MVDDLSFKEIDIINFILLTHVFVVIHEGMNISIFNPPILVNQALLDVFIPKCTDYFGIDRVILFIPSKRLMRKIQILFKLLLVLPFILLVLLEIIIEFQKLFVF